MPMQILFCILFFSFEIKITRTEGDKNQKTPKPKQKKPQVEP